VRLRQGLGALGLYVLLALLLTYPLSLHPGSRVSYEGDPLLNSLILSHSGPTLLTEPGRLFALPAFVPYPDALLFSEHLIFPSLLAWPLSAATRNPLLAHNLLVLLFLALSGWSMFLLARRLLGDAGAALLAGVLYGGHTFLVNEVPRIQIQAQFFFPLGLLALVEHFERPRARTAAAFAVVVLLCGLSNNYYLLYMPLLFGLTLPWLLPRAPAGLRLHALGLLAAFVLPLALVFVPLALRYTDAAARYGFSRELPMGVGLEKYLATRPENWLYGETVAGVRLQTQAAHFTGFLPLGLAALAAVRGLRRGRPERGLVALAAVGAALFALLSLGQDVAAFGRRLGPGPYRLLFDLVPGFALVRIPERLALLAMFWLALLAAFGARELLTRAGRRRAALAGALVAAVALEHVSIPIRTIRLPTGEEIPEAYRWLRGYRAQRVAEVPFYGPWLNRLDALPMYFATGSPRAIVNGYTGFYPPAYAFLRHALSSEPGPFFLETLERLGVDHIVVHPHLWGERERPAWLAFLAGAQDRLRLVREFPGEARGGEPAWDHGGELVYQVRHPGAPADPPLPERTPLPRGSRWTVSASRGPEPEAVLDGDPRTEWATGDVSTAGDFLELRFQEDLEFRGVRLLLVYPHTGYAGRLEVSVRHPDGRWRLAYFDREAADRELLRRLLQGGRDSWHSLDFAAPVRGNAVRLLVARGDPMLEMWRVAELQVYR
jgi:hypothetical protein